MQKKGKLLSLILCFALVFTLIPAIGTETASAAEVTNIEVVYDANKAPVNPLYKHNEWDDKFGENNKAGAFSVSSTDYKFTDNTGSCSAILLAKANNSGSNYQSVSNSSMFSGYRYNISDSEYLYAIMVEVSIPNSNTFSDSLNVTVKSPTGSEYEIHKTEKRSYNTTNRVEITFKVPVDTAARVASFEVKAEDSSSSVQQNTTKKFVTDNWRKSEGANTSVKWSVTGNAKPGTTINSSTGVLTVAADEPTTSRLKVRATCTAPAYSHLYAEKEVTVSERAPYIDRIEIKAIPESVTSVGKGTTQSFEAYVYGTANREITWSVKGGSTGTSIVAETGTYTPDDNSFTKYFGVLTVSDEETASSLTVKATSTYYTSKCGTKEVTVVNTTEISNVDITATLPKLSTGNKYLRDYSISPSTSTAGCSTDPISWAERASDGTISYVNDYSTVYEYRDYLVCIPVDASVGYKFTDATAVKLNGTVAPAKVTIINPTTLYAYFDLDVEGVNYPDKTALSASDTTYTGNTQTAVINGFNADTMQILASSNIGTDAGNYEIVIKPIIKWSDGTTESIKVPWKILKADKEAPTGLIGYAPTTSGGSDGKIYGTTTAMEYSTDGNTWKACSADETTGLLTVNYQVRYKETTNYKASAAVEVKVPASGQFTITFVPYDGTVTRTYAITDASGKLSSLPMPTRSGHSFKGWYREGSEEKVTVDTVFTAHETLEARWDIVSSGGSGGGGALPLPPAAEKPEITADSSQGKVELSEDGTAAVITPADGYEIDKVTVNGKEVTVSDSRVTGLKTGDKVVVIFKQKAAEPSETVTVAEKLEKVQLATRSSRTSKKNIKVTLKTNAKTAAAIRDIKDMGYTVKYKFYRSTKKSAGYKATVTKKVPSYINTLGKKGKSYYYKARVMVYDSNGKLVAQSKLAQCKYAKRLWTR